MAMANIELPKDAEGREIPLDTKVLYLPDGSGHGVLKWEFYQDNNIPWVITLETGNTHIYRCPDCVYLAPPDSWEKLEEDLGRGADALNYEACAYFGRNACNCSSCIADKGETCERVVMHDIADRIRKLLLALSAAIGVG